MATYTSNTFSVTVSGAEGVTGPITPDGQVTIAYDGVNGFGATGPTVDLFDDFRTGPDGATVTMTDPVVGSWSTYASSGDTPTYETSTSRSNGVCYRGYGNGYTRAGLYRNTTPVNEFFVSYAVKVPNYHPGELTTQAQFPSVSSAKWLWVSDDLGWAAEGKTDVCLPTTTGLESPGTDFQAAIIQIQGNDGTNASDWKPDPFGDTRLTRSGAWGGTKSGWWRWNEWMRMSFWMKAGADADVDAGDLYAQVISVANGMSEASSSGYPVFNGSNAETVDWFGLCAFLASSNSGMDLYFDDFYLAVGAGAAARVEIGDNATYASCTDLALATVDSWSNTSVTCTLRSGAFTGFSNKYIHIHDANNNYVGSSRLIS